MSLARISLRVLLGVGVVYGAAYANGLCPSMQSQFRVTGILVSSNCPLLVEYLSSEGGSVEVDLRKGVAEGVLQRIDRCIKRMLLSNSVPSGD